MDTKCHVKSLVIFKRFFSFSLKKRVSFDFHARTNELTISFATSLLYIFQIYVELMMVATSYLWNIGSIICLCNYLTKKRKEMEIRELINNLIEILYH